MILLLGASGYIGQAFERELGQRGHTFVSLSRQEIDYARFTAFRDYVRKTKPAFIINAAGYSGKPNVDACETARAETIEGNTLFPQMVAHVCAEHGIPWGHVSSGCIYAGAKVVEDGVARIEKDLAKPKVRSLFDSNPEKFAGFNEFDEPNFSFRQPPCSSYSGTKAMAEEAIHGIGQCYLWRLRMPFDEFDHSRNYLSKLQRYPKIYDNVNSISHRSDAVRACLALWECRAAFGIYNITNQGAVTTRQVAQLIQRALKPTRPFEFWSSDEEFYRVGVKAPRSNCILDVSKLLAAGIKMRPVREALEAALEEWETEN